MQPVPQFYYTYSPEKLPLSFGLGVYAPYGLGLKWPDDASFRTISQEGRLLFVSVNPVVAWKVLPELSIAAGPMINYSKIKLRQGIAFPGDEFLFRGDDMDLGFNAGLLYQPHEKWSFGINYRSASTMNYTGSAKTSPSPPFPPNPTRSSAEVKYPQTVGFGISFRPTPQWNFEIDIDWTDWERLDTVNFKNTPFGDVPLQLNWKSSFFYEAGATYYLPRNYFISFGYFYSQNSTRDLNYNPTVPDTDLHTASLGVGNRGQHWRWALAGQLITGPYNVVSGSTPNATTGQSADGKYQFFIPAATLSIGYHF
jgi:long-chain fatty acid transport protein